jgi:predicted permease
MRQMLRQSVRLLLKSPATTLAAVASLALGIGANTTIFSLIDAVVLRPLPLVWRSDRLVSIADARGFTLSSPTFRDFAAGTRTLSSLAAFQSRGASITAGDTSRVTSVEVASGSYFRTLGIVASEGRLLEATDDRPGNDALVLSSAFWQQSFGGDAGILGRRVLVNGEPFTVVGIAPAGFKGVRLGGNPAGWITINAWPRAATGQFRGLDVNSRGWSWLQLVGRLREGTGPEQVRAELNTLAHTQARLYPSAISADFQVGVAPLRVAASGLRTRADLTRFVVLLLGVVLAVLGVACANVSGLLLARALARRRELAIRVALGASRRRIAMEGFVDALVLAAVSTVAGVLAAMWTIDLLQGIQLPGGIDMSMIDVRISGLTVVASAGVGLLASFAFGAVPALQGARADVVSGLKEHSAGQRGSRQVLRGALVAAQVALSLVLLVGASLFARTLQTTLSGDLGFNPEGIAYAATNLSLERYDGSRSVAFYRDVLKRLRATPSVATAAWTRLIPGTGEDVESVEIPGYAPRSGERPEMSTNLVTPGYFETMQIPIVAGRAFAAEEASQSRPVVVVNETAARTFWNGSAVGRQLTIQNTETTIVGVARDVPSEPGAPSVPAMYGNALQQINEAQGPFFLIARTEGNPAAVIPALSDAIRAAGPTAPLLEARTMNQHLLEVLAVQRSAAALLGLLSVIAIVLSASGIYAMVAFWVSERTREFGVRMALGATKGIIRRTALKHVALVILGGMAMGLPLAWLLGRASRSLLFQLSPVDPLSFAAATLLLLFVALVASVIPAQRAARTDPLKALRAATE